LHWLPAKARVEYEPSRIERVKTWVVRDPSAGRADKIEATPTPSAPSTATAAVIIIVVIVIVVVVVVAIAGFAKITPVAVNEIYRVAHDVCIAI
jgi:hypothetical protein